MTPGLEGFGLLVGHLVGDYLLQNDVMAKHKTLSHPGEQPYPTVDEFKHDDFTEFGVRFTAWSRAIRAYHRAGAACTVHCLLYTLAVWACSWWWMPWWGLVVCFAVHWPIDRFRLARLWMWYAAGQREFASGPLAPWSVIVVDQVFHLLTLFVIAMLA